MCSLFFILLSFAIAKAEELPKPSKLSQTDRVYVEIPGYGGEIYATPHGVNFQVASKTTSEVLAIIFGEKTARSLNDVSQKVRVVQGATGVTLFVGHTEACGAKGNTYVLWETNTQDSKEAAERSKNACDLQTSLRFIDNK